MLPILVVQAGIMWADGSGVSWGSIDFAEKTQEAYILDPFASDSSMMSRTGDLGLWRADGSIETRRRVDDRVKVKDFRTELDGISTSLTPALDIIRVTNVLIDGHTYEFILSKSGKITPDIVWNVLVYYSHARLSLPRFTLSSTCHSHRTARSTRKILSKWSQI